MPTHDAMLERSVNIRADRDHGTPQTPDRINPKVSAQTCGIIQKLYETKHIETMMFVKSVMGHFSKIEPKLSKKGIKNG